MQEVYIRRLKIHLQVQISIFVKSSFCYKKKYRDRHKYESNHCRFKTISLSVKSFDVKFVIMHYELHVYNKTYISVKQSEM